MPGNSARQHWEKIVEINQELAQKVLDTIGHGLVRGLGEQEHGKMCVEAAVCYAMGLPHSDKPTCVGEAVREYKIRINDSNWTSDAARAKGMKRVAVAQLGSEHIDQLIFAKRVAVLSINQILSKVLRDAKLESDAVKCEEFTDFEKITDFCNEIKKSTAYAIANAYADANADAIANAYADANAYTNAYTNAYANTYAIAIAYANASAIAYANASAIAYAKIDELLTMACEVAVQALQEQNCEGCNFLYLCD
jgi:hypothetical protein